ncbi:MAG: hypothetical protein M1815_006260 [Lichina confinis]|nr:MAG: hypothetical protein M1815_006260 [Lichina confinis]
MGFNVAWTEYQGWLVEKLNLMTAGTTDENSTHLSLLKQYARQPDMAALFNYASMSVNNDIFFNALSPGPTTIPPDLLTGINRDFKSVDLLRGEMIATAKAMFGPGFVWLVKLQGRPEMKVLTTYLAGSPYPQAHYRLQMHDMSTQWSASYRASMSSNEYVNASEYMNSPGRLGSKPTTAPGGVAVAPLLCVNTWQHVWLTDYGIKGKDTYLERWWDRINWSYVDSNYTTNKSSMRDKLRR